MKIINPAIEIMHTGLEKDFMTPEQFIEKVGRTCYKSEDKITEESAPKFVRGLVKRGHEAMIEHWSLIFKTDETGYETVMGDLHMMLAIADIGSDKRLRPFIRSTIHEVEDEVRYIISGNMRAWRDFLRVYTDDLIHIPEYLLATVRDYPNFFPEYQHLLPKRNPKLIKTVLTPITVNDLVGEFEHSVHHDVTVKFICDRGVSHEIVRHRTASFAQESTRYCNYGLGKFGSEITLVMPAKWIDIPEEKLVNDPQYATWYSAGKNAETDYDLMLVNGATPQEARAVLPNSLKTEVIMTANLDCWDHFFKLRCAPDAHPDIQVVAKMVRDEFWNLFPERYIVFPTDCKEG